MKLFLILSCSLILLSTGACMENYNDRYYIKDYFVEFEEATTKGKALGQTYVLSSQGLSTDEETLRIQINLVGAPLESEQVIHFRVLEDISTAVQGKDYQLPEDNAIHFPANTNIAYLEINPGNQGSGESLLVLELIGNELIQPSENYKQLGISCKYP